VNNIAISKVRNEDVRDLKEIEIQCELSPWTIEAYECELERPDSIILKATSDDRDLCGFIVGRSSLEAGDAEIYNLGVAAHFRRQGIAGTLIEEFRRICAERGNSSVWLEVRAANKTAIEFYIAHGFIQKGVRPGFYHDPPDDALLMSAAIS
jgi:ribosomal-protein-alanine N-acetyltransferase